MSKILCLSQSGGLACPYSDNRYKKICVVGEGFHGKVYKAVDKMNGDLVAIKVIDLKRANTSHAKQEVENHQTLLHPNVIRLRQAFRRGDSYVYLVMDYADHGNLYQFLVDRSSCGGRLPEPVAHFFFSQLISAVNYCHCKGVVSRDIKLSNILLSTDKNGGPFPTIQLCDFGFSLNHEKSSTSAVVGTLDYLAPEVIKNNGKYAYEGQKVDIWSCGVVLYNLVTGYQPFSGTRIGEKPTKASSQQLLERIVNAEYSFPSEVTVSSECIDLIASCLEEDPSKRISVLNIPRHAWFTQNLGPGGLMQTADLMEMPALSL